MRSVPVSKLTCVVGLLSVTAGGCGSSNSDTLGGGGSTSGAELTGGTTSAATSGATTGGANPGVGGTTSNGTTAVSIGGASTGGTSAVAPTSATGGAPSTGGAGIGGKTNAGGSSARPTGGAPGAGGAATGGLTSAPPATGGSAVAGGSATGGRTSTGGGSGSVTGGRTGTSTGGTSASSTTGGSTFSGTCVASKATGTNVSGTGTHKVTVETNSDTGINEGTIFRPTDLGGATKYPIFVWGEGGCSLDGLSNSAALAEIASYGYFVIADGTPNNKNSRSMDTSNPVAMGKPLLNYVTWAIAENEKPCSAYYHSLDTTKVAANGFSCGGLMAEGTAGDPRITTWGLNSSGLFSANTTFYKTIHTPVLIVLGGTSDMAYENGERDYTNITGQPIMLFSKNLGHGGDLFSSHGGDFTKIDLAWLNWWLKGDETATGKGVLVGSGCSYCTNSAWEVKSKNMP